MNAPLRFSLFLFSFCLVLFFSISTSWAQDNVGIGTATPDANALLDLTVPDPVSNPMGLLFPRLTTAQRTGMTLGAAQQGLVVYDSDVDSVFVWNGSMWTSSGSGASGDDLGNHTATQNLDLATYELVGQGADTGLVMGPNGIIGINSPVVPADQVAIEGHDAADFGVVSYVNRDAAGSFTAGLFGGNNSLHSTGTRMGVRGISKQNLSGNNVGVSGYASGSTLQNTGLQGQTGGTFGDQIGVYGDAIGNTTGSRFGVYGSVSGSSSGNNYGMYALNSASSAGNAFGGFYRVTGEGGVMVGLQAEVNSPYDATQYGLNVNVPSFITTANKFGVRSMVQGTANLNYGLYADVSGATSNFAYYGAAGGFHQSDSAYFGGPFRINNYNLPPADGLAGQVMVTDGAGTLIWVDTAGWSSSPTATLNYFTESETGAVDSGKVLTPIGIDQGIVLQTLSTGYLSTDEPDGAATGGNARGDNAVDLQMDRFQNTQVASGSYSVITGGRDNSALDFYSVVSGGTSNISGGSYSAIVGGNSNEAYSQGAFVGAGLFNLADGNSAALVGGTDNQSIGFRTFIGAGQFNRAYGDDAAVLAGRYNIAQSYSETVLGLYNDTLVGASTTSWVGTDPLLTVGNGTGIANRSNALVVDKDGAMGLDSTLSIGFDDADGYTLPPADGLAGQVMVTDGAGGLAWYDTTNWYGGGGDDLGSHVATTSLFMEDSTIALRTSGDFNHGLRYAGTGLEFASEAPDGPALFGYDGGVLGTTNGGESITAYWNASGQFGIGTTAPTRALHVMGDQYLEANRPDFDLQHTGSGGFGGILAWADAGGRDMEMTYEHTLEKLFWYNPGIGEVMTLGRNSGRLEIFTQADQYGFEHNSGLSNIEIATYSDDVANVGLFGTRTATDLAFYTNDNIFNPSMTITNAGNVGIGTIAPSQPLQVENTGYGFSHTDGVHTMSSYIAGDQVELGSETYARLGFYVDNALPSVILDTTEFFGIGVNDPAERLHVGGSIRSDSLAGTGDRIVEADLNGTLFAERIAPFRDFMIMREQEPDGAPGITLGGGPNQRNLNTIVANAGTSVGLNTGTNIITLQPGTYLVKAHANLSTYSNANHVIRLFDLTNSTILVAGVNTSTTNDGGPSPGGGVAYLEGYFTLSNAIDAQLEHVVDGGGEAGIPIPDGEPEIYSQVLIERVE